MGTHDDEICRTIARRDFLLKAATGTVITGLGGGLYVLADSLQAKEELRADGRPRVPPGQRVITELKPMGGVAGNPSRGELSLRVHGEVEKPFEIDFRELLAMDVVEQYADVHCVTGWTMLDAKWKGVRVKE